MGDPVSLVERLRVLVVCLALEMGVIVGVPMRPEQIQALMRQMNQPHLADVLPIENDQGDDPPDSAI